MNKNFPLLNNNFLLLIFLCFSALVFAQQKPMDSTQISVRKDFSLPNPTRYEPFYDVKTGMYYLYPKIGNTVVGAPIILTSKEYSDYQLKKQLTNYFQKKLLFIRRHIH